MNSEEHQDEWYFNTVTGEPELGKLSPANQRSGPYRTRKDALDAWNIAQERNLMWDEQDKRWNAWQA